jgi:hypothetical protein
MSQRTNPETFSFTAKYALFIQTPLLSTRCLYEANDLKEFHQNLGCLSYYSKE